MVTRNRDFDLLVSDVSRTAPPVSAYQKRVAYARLMQAASQQTVLPPLALMAPRLPLWSRMISCGEAVYRWLRSLMVDETHYERARQYRLAYPSWSNGYGGSGLAIQIFEPSRYPLGVPV